MPDKKVGLLSAQELIYLGEKVGMGISLMPVDTSRLLATISSLQSENERLRNEVKELKLELREVQIHSRDLPDYGLGLEEEKP